MGFYAHFYMHSADPQNYFIFEVCSKFSSILDMGFWFYTRLIYFTYMYYY